MEIVFLILLVLFMIILSGIVSGSEAALLSVNLAKAKEIATSAKSLRKRKKGEKLLLVKEDINRYITTIVVINNIVNIVGSIYVGIYAANIFGQAFLGIFSGILTFLIIMFAEIIPKVYGDKHSDTISLNIVSPLIFLTKIFTPVNFLLDRISTFCVRGTNTKQVSEGEIKVMAELGKQEGSINSYESGVIENVFKMNDIEVYDIMIPKSNVVSIDIDESFKNIAKLADKTGFTRFPVTKHNEIIGLINVKDLFKFHSREKSFKVQKILRPIIYAPESMKVSTLEDKLKRNRIHMAAIVNEHGDFVGIATLEDIIEEILGEIEDEFDAEEDSGIEEIAEDKFSILASVELQALNERFNLDLDEEEDYNTLNGYLSSELGKIPKVNDKVKLEKADFRVIKANKKKALKVELLIK